MYTALEVAIDGPCPLSDRRAACGNTKSTNLASMPLSTFRVYHSVQCVLWSGGNTHGCAAGPTAGRPGHCRNAAKNSSWLRRHGPDEVSCEWSGEAGVLPIQCHPILAEAVHHESCPSAQRPRSNVARGCRVSHSWRSGEIWPSSRVPVLQIYVCTYGQNCTLHPTRCPTSPVERARFWGCCATT